MDRSASLSNPEALEYDITRAPSLRVDVAGAISRVLAAGAAAPLRYLGAGGQAMVFCDARGVGYKAARSLDPTRLELIEDEAAWLSMASQVPGVREHVARFGRWHPAPLAVIERECVLAHGDRRPREGKLWDLHRVIGAAMAAYGWGMPEFKADSYIQTRGRGPVLVDAGFAHRRGVTLARHVARLHRTDLPAQDRADWRWHLQMELGEGLDPVVGQRLHDRLAAMDNPGARHVELPGGSMKSNPWWKMTDAEMAHHKQRLEAEAAKERAMRRGAVGTKAATKSKAACGAKRNPAHAMGRAAMRGITKTGIVQHITERTGVTTKQAREVLDEVAALARRELAKTGQFTVPDVATLRVVKTAARKARSGTNPFTGQAMKIPAKPAGRAVKAKPAGALKGRK